MDVCYLFWSLQISSWLLSYAEETAQGKHCFLKYFSKVTCLQGCIWKHFVQTRSGQTWNLNEKRCLETISCFAAITSGLVGYFILYSKAKWIKFSFLWSQIEVRRTDSTKHITLFFSIALDATHTYFSCTLISDSMTFCTSRFHLRNLFSHTTLFVTNSLLFITWS